MLTSFFGGVKSSNPGNTPASSSTSSVSLQQAETADDVEQCIFTVGHSNVSAEAFLALISQHSIKKLVDVRSIPSSRRFPHFSKKSLESLCHKQGISYQHCPQLGGKEPGIVKNLMKPEGQMALAKLAEASREDRTVYMCAESDWRDCHRQVIAHRLLKDFGIVSIHILRNGSTQSHPSTYKLPAHFAMPLDYSKKI